MRRTGLWYAVVLVSMFSLASCGGRKNDAANQNEELEETSGPASCVDGSDCRSGVCEGGFCADASACTAHNECSASQYCHFPSAPNPWEAGTPGECSGPCISDDTCGIIGQECHAGRCYTNIDCNPANNHTDCPPGEVCWQDSQTCKWPPDQCYFNEQCPAGWVCNEANECTDPTVLGNCNIDEDCDNKPGCEDGACECFEGTCQVAGGCDLSLDPVEQCGEGNYCAGGVCQPATACPNGQDTCTPYGLVCEGGYCINPEPCGQPGNVCDEEGFVCRTNFTPPACYPEGAGECTRNELCPPGQYCELFTGTCEDGCRDSPDCEGECNGNLPCNCNGEHICVNEVIGEIGASCTSTEDCTGGTVCAVDTPGLEGLACQLGGGAIPGCTKSCRVACDLLAAGISNPCPAGETCGSGDLFSDLIAMIFGGSSGDGSGTASVCYPPQ